MDSRVRILEEGKIGARPNWDEYFMKLALDVASRSTCFNVHAGAVLVLNKRIIGTGYNGASSGVKSCLDRGSCFKETKTGKSYSETLNSGNCIGVHAEMNALAHMTSLNYVGATIYITIFPCVSCVKNLLSYGIKRIVFKRTYDESEISLGLDLLQEGGVEVYQFNISPERYIDISFNRSSVIFDVWSEEEKKTVLGLLGNFRNSEKETLVGTTGLNLNL